MELKAWWFEWANQKPRCIVWALYVGAFVSFFPPWNHPLYLKREEYVTVAARSVRVCVTTFSLRSSFNTRITCDITLLLRGERCRAQANAKGKRPPKVYRMDQEFGRIRKKNPELPENKLHHYKTWSSRSPGNCLSHRYRGFCYFNRCSHAPDALT